MNNIKTTETDSQRLQISELSEVECDITMFKMLREKKSSFNELKLFRNNFKGYKTNCKNIANKLLLRKHIIIEIKGNCWV